MKASRGQPKKNCSDQEQYSDRLKLADLGIDRKLSSRSQRGPAPNYSREYRKSRKERLQVAAVLVDEGYLLAWDERDLRAIDAAIFKVVVLWAVRVRTGGVDPLRCDLTEQAESYPSASGDD